MNDVKRTNARVVSRKRAAKFLERFVEQETARRMSGTGATGESTAGGNKKRRQSHIEGGGVVDESVLRLELALAALKGEDTIVDDDVVE